MKLLGPAQQGVVPFVEELRFTHIAHYRTKRHFTGGYEWEGIGTMQVDINNPVHVRKLLRTDTLLRYKFTGIEVDRYMEKLDEVKKDRSFSDYQRFKRKMGMVLRAYEEEKVQIHNLEFGIFVDTEMDRLNANLQEAWDKALAIYGFTQEQYYNPPS